MDGDPYSDLGVRPLINASATLTRLGGSLMPPPVVEAMVAASRSFVDLELLQRRAGERLAGLTRNQAGYVSSGAAAGISLAVAACLTRGDAALIERLPHVGGFPRPQVVVLRAQRNPYQVAIRLTGAEEVEIEGTEQALRSALAADRAACVVFFAGAHWPAVDLTLPQLIATAHHRGVPVLVDAAAQIPPISSLWRFTVEEGADAVILSGGKGLRGPQPSGLVLGAPWIIEACRALGSPNRALGRPMKVGKEEMVGLVRAVELALEQDEAALLAGYEAVVAGWVEGLAGLRGVRAERGYPSEAGQPHPRAIVTIDPAPGRTRDQVVQRLLDGEPAVAVAALGEDRIALNPQTLAPGEEEIVLRRLRSVLCGR